MSVTWLTEQLSEHGITLTAKQQQQFQTYYEAGKQCAEDDSCPLAVDVSRETLIPSISGAHTGERSMLVIVRPLRCFT